MVKIQYSFQTGRMKITSKPSSHGVGDISIIRQATKDIIEQLDGRSKAYFLAITTHGNLKIYNEIKPYKIW